MVCNLPVAWAIGHGCAEVAEQPTHTSCSSDADDDVDEEVDDEEVVELDAGPLELPDIAERGTGGRVLHTAFPASFHSGNGQLCGREALSQNGYGQLKPRSLPCFFRWLNGCGGYGGGRQPPRRI